MNKPALKVIDNLLASGDLRMLPIDSVEAKVGLGKTTIYSMMADEQFPLCRKIGRTTKVGWLSSEIDEWLILQPQVSFDG